MLSYVRLSQFRWNTFILAWFTDNLVKLSYATVIRVTLSLMGLTIPTFNIVPVT